MALRSERVFFPGTGGLRLAARLERPSGPPAATALFAHCFTCTKDLRPIVRISRLLAAAGIAVLRFDFTGLGESDGEFADTTFSTNTADLVAAAAYLRRELLAPSLLVGHSLGGAAVLVAAAGVAECRAVATIAAPSEPGHLRRLLPDELSSSGEAIVELGGRRLRLRRELLEDLERHDLRRAVAELGRPLLLFHAPEDRVVGIEHARRLFDAARHPKSFVALDRTDHLLLADERSAVFVGEMLATWARRYILPPGSPSSAGPTTEPIRSPAE